MMNDHGKSERSVVSVKSSNNAGKPTAAEGMERRDLAKGNLQEQNTRRIQCRERVQSALERVRQVAVKESKAKFTNLMHHIYSPDTLEEAYFSLKKDASAGVDGETWQSYAENWEENLKDLSERLKRGAYRAKPVKRVFIPKTDGKQRPLGVTALEDKIVQRAAVEVMNAIYETDFLGFSYGYRPGRSQHDCLDSLYVGLLTKHVNFVIDADISGFFDGINHEWLMKFVEHRISDPKVLRLIRKWLNAGVMEKGVWQASEVGTPQGGSASPLLANIFLHYVFDLWAHDWRKKHSSGDVVIVRWADDFVVGFQKKSDADRFLKELHKRFAKFELKLHPEKTKLIEFGPFAIENRKRKNQGRPETFNFLGFTHICGKKRKNKMFTVIRKTIKKRMGAKLKEIKAELKRRMHEPIPEVGKWLRSVVGGHFRYYGVPTNERSLCSFRFQVGRYWHHALKRRGQKNPLTWERMNRLVDKWFPLAKAYHPYPLQRRGVTT